MARDPLTPTQARILAVLADGLPHDAEELRACLYDELGAASNVRFHLTNLRKRLRPRGEDVVCQRLDGRACYRHVRLLASAADGKS